MVIIINKTITAMAEEKKELYKFTDGSTYEGHWVENVRQGHGVFIWKSGAKYEGMWKADKKHGKGKMTF